jgi:uncharacterized protein (DUF2141 family)
MRAVCVTAITERHRIVRIGSGPVGIFRLVTNRDVALGRLSFVEVPAELSHASSRIVCSVYHLEAAMKLPILSLALASLSASWSCSAEVRDVGVIVSGIGKTTGDIICRLHAGDRGFPLDEGDIVQTVRYAASAELITCTFPGVEPGRYAISVMHDENGNGAFDRNFTGKPKEPWGVSNNVRPERRSPRFGEASVQIGESGIAMFEVALQR